MTDDHELTAAEIEAFPAPWAQKIPVRFSVEHQTSRRWTWLRSAAVREPQTGEAVFAEVDVASGPTPELDAAVKQVKAALADIARLKLRTRRMVERLTRL